MKSNYEAIVKARMVKRAPKELLGGTFRGGVYPHIYKALKDNFIDETFPNKKCLKGNLTDAEIKYHYAEHLNSSQTMCIAYFKKFFESKEYENLLAKILMIQGIEIAECGEFTDAVFEHIPYAKEGTNFDFYLRLSNGRQITWEIKFTEREFGGITKSGGEMDKYLTKYEAIYVPMLLDCAYYDSSDEGSIHDMCSINEFYKYYQIRRNILYARTSEDWVLFLTPRENRALDEGRDYIEHYATKCGTDHIRNIYWEDLLETTIRVVSCEPELLAYYTQFKEKYFE